MRRPLTRRPTPGTNWGEHDREGKGAWGSEEIAELREQVDADFGAVKKSYTIGGKPMTDAHVEAIRNCILENPEVGSRLSIEQVARVVFPDAVKKG